MGLAQHEGKVDRPGRDRQGAVFRLGQRQQVVQPPMEELAAVDDMDQRVLQCSAILRPAQRHFCFTAHHGDGRAQFMADLGQEQPTPAIDIAQPLIGLFQGRRAGGHLRLDRFRHIVELGGQML